MSGAFFRTGRMADRVLALILGGGAGQRLYPLTMRRAKPAVPLGGKYRLIDIPVSNCINSDMHRIFILTQYNSASLNRHIARTYRFSRFTNGFVEILAAEITPERPDWFQGTADAVRQSLHHLDDYKGDTILVLSGDHLYRMDYRDFVARHNDTNADVTLSVTAARAEDASGFGLVKIDDTGRVIEFSEKPTGPALEHMRVDTTKLGLSGDQAGRRPFVASMGIYVFRKEVLRQLLLEELPGAADFGKEIIPQALSNYNVQAHLFDGYWEDIGTMGSFYRANIEMTHPLPPFNVFDAEAPMYTRPRYLPGSKLLDCHVLSSVITEGCIINGATITDSIVGIRSRIEHDSRLNGVLMMGADFYQTIDEMREDVNRGYPRIGVGSNCAIRKAIIDKNARIGAGVKIMNENEIQELDGQGYFIRDGVVIIPKNGVIPDGTVI
ncbi:MAG TPA: glucose-1-phosphate adenylyltransferase [Blastocatellia bacterium]|nr:glucose-1-phosphate adenylyltransferase [Blastocatellia bacterium]